MNELEVPPAIGKTLKLVIGESVFYLMKKACFIKSKTLPIFV